MPAMSKIAIAATAGAAVTCFVAPGARRVQATTAPALRGQGSTGAREDDEIELDSWLGGCDHLNT